MELKHPLFFLSGFLLLGLFFFISKKKKHPFQEGVKIANTEYIKKTPYFQKKWRQYQRYLWVLRGLFAISLVSILFLLARPAKIDKIIPEEYNRDIILCMDVSASVDELNYQIVENLKRTVNGLKGERFGISIFNSSSATVSPLTDDYEYITSILDKLETAFHLSQSNNYEYEDEGGDYFDYSMYIIYGTSEGNNGSSLIGDGLASCVYNFPDLEEEQERTRIIIFSTDNSLAGTPLLTLEEAAQIAKKYNVLVYGIGTDNISPQDQTEFQKAAELTGGKLFNSKTETVSQIIDEIEKTSKSRIQEKEIQVTQDIPQIPFYFLLGSMTLLILIRKKVSL